MQLSDIDWRDPATKRNAVMIGIVGLVVLVLAVIYIPRGSGKGPGVFTQSEPVTQPPTVTENQPVPEAGSHRVAPQGQ